MLLKLKLIPRSGTVLDLPQFFTTPFNQYRNRIGQRFTVLGHNREAEDDIVRDGGDYEDLYRIRFDDGAEIDAWGHEVCVLTDPAIDQVSQGLEDRKSI
jgi:hypothetical protein